MRNRKFRNRQTHHAHSQPRHEGNNTFRIGLPSLAVIGGLFLMSSAVSAEPLLSDNFDRADGLLGHTSSGETWLLSGQAGNDTNVVIDNNQMKWNVTGSGDAPAAAPVDVDLDGASHYTVTFDMIADDPNANDFSTEQLFMFLPRAEGSDAIGNVGWGIQRVTGTGKPGNAEVVVFEGGDRDKDGHVEAGEGVVPEHRGIDPFQTWTIIVEGNSATLKIGDEVIDKDRSLGSPAGNGTKDRVMFAYEITGSVGNEFSNRIDNLKVVPNKASR